MKLAVIHYFPISYYPPAINLVDMIEDDIDVEIITQMPDKGTLVYSPQKSHIYMPTRSKGSDTSILRLLKYVWFVLYSVFRLCLRHPDEILYYESISAMPAFIYKKYINRMVNIRIHYHEYMSPEEYAGAGQRLMAYNHKIEQRWLYSHASWVSHTNDTRMQLFMSDNPMIPNNIIHILPNYPPKSWLKKNKRHGGNVVKCVYVGSLSMKDTFVMEFCKWVISQKGLVTFDIYSYNFHGDTLQAITELKSDYINFHNMGLRYHEIPDVLDNYDVGLLLYKAKNINFKYNETNKFYEYITCGLDVWYPKEMLMLHDMDKTEFAPQIKEMDFDNIDSFDGTVKRDVVDNSKYNRFADNVYSDFEKYLKHECI